jgi:hypothetical protein
MVMLEWIDPRLVVRSYLLMAVRDGYDRILVARGADQWYNAAAWREGCEEPLAAPPPKAMQRLPAVLATYRRLDLRIWSWLTRWLRRRLSGSELGRFKFRINGGSVPVTYRVRWAAGCVAEAEITLTPSEALVAAARQQLSELFRDDEG